ncbi:unnamed protein product [Rotaria sordida]|uniref:RRM domain-containing protein n=1 Tax=Rotaria sordida TaxID=392033 RepID=A0A813SD63_9BILA|nr:unnamed protein product [Rotaria sordida]CAF0859292.1 unnamed protein product [Rotaria sordida]CAF3601663.1 unnamed protein product [Rotaria sordida]CAF3689816.1 unnamed protein product [Rotaria sordida]
MHGRDLRRNHGGNYNHYGYQNRNNKRSGPARNHVIPSEPPYTAYIGNAPDTMVQGDFEHHLFVGLKVKQVRLIRDRQTDRFRGFAYVDFEDADSLRSAIALDGTCVNDQPIRIDVASRTLGATKSEGFRNKSGFESRNSPRQQSSGHNNNNNRSGGGFRHDGQDHNKQKISQDIDDGCYGNGYNDDYYDQNNSNERKSQVDKEQPSSTSRKVSDDVFITSDLLTSNDNENYEHNNIKQDLTSMTKQQTRNWADCPIDDSVVETSSSSNVKNILTSDDVDDIQFVCDKTSKLPTPSRLMGNQSIRGRNSRGLQSSQISNDERRYYDQMSSSSSYPNQSQQYYHHHHNSQIQLPPVHIGLSYHHDRNQTSLGSRQKSNFNNRNYRDEQSNRDGKCLTSTTNNNSLHDTDMSTISSENRPRLNLLPRSQKVSSSSDDKSSVEPSTRNASIFGCGKPRDEHDPKLAELNKHIEEIVEKEQHLSRTTSTTSNESTSSVTKPVRILTARSESSTDH